MYFFHKILDFTNLKAELLLLMRWFRYQVNYLQKWFVIVYIILLRK